MNKKFSMILKTDLVLLKLEGQGWNVLANRFQVGQFLLGDISPVAEVTDSLEDVAELLVQISLRVSKVARDEGTVVQERRKVERDGYQVAQEGCTEAKAKTEGKATRRDRVSSFEKKEGRGEKTIEEEKCN